MPARAVLFALDGHDAERLLACQDEPWSPWTVSGCTIASPRSRFDAYQGTSDAEDIAYTQAFLPGLQDFYRTAAQNGRAVIFTVGQ